MFGCGPKKNSDKSKSVEDLRFFKSQKILLLGTGESGKTTIIKQMKIIHINGFSEEEKKEKIPFIKSNISESIYDILYNMDTISPPVELDKSENEDARKYILQIGPSPLDYNEEYFDKVKQLWEDRGVQNTFRRSNEYQLIDSAQHFLDRIDEIRQENYIPTTQDILFCRIKTIAISEIEFDVQVPKKFGGGSAHFIMYDVGGQRGERRKWIQVFEGIQVILFIIAASDFDQTLREDNTRNRLEEAFNVFREIYKSRYLRDGNLIVFLNKQDLLQRKIEQGRKLEDYFPAFGEFKQSVKNDLNEYERAQLFMRQQIIDLSAKTERTVDSFNPLTRTTLREKLPARDTYIHYTVATDTRNIKKIFDSVHEIIIKINTKITIY